MVFARECAEGFLDFLFRRLGRHTQNFIIVFEISGHGDVAYTALDHSLLLWPVERLSHFAGNLVRALQG